MITTDGDIVDRTKYHQYLFETNLFILESSSTTLWKEATDEEKLEWYETYDQKYSMELFDSADNLAKLMRKRILSVEPYLFGYKIIATAESEEEVDKYVQLYGTDLDEPRNNHIIIPEKSTHNFYLGVAIKKSKISVLQFEQLYKAEQHTLMILTMPAITTFVLVTTHLFF